MSREIWQLQLEEKRNYDHILWVSEAGKFADSEVVSSSGRISLWFFAKLMNTWKRKYERWGNNLQMYMSNLIKKFFWSATKGHCSNLNDWIKGSKWPVIRLHKQETLILKTTLCLLDQVWFVRQSNPLWRIHGGLTRSDQICRIV